MRPKRFIYIALGLALCAPLAGGQSQLSFAASSKNTSSFSYTSKVVGNTVTIYGNSATATKTTTAPKVTVSKAPASKPATTSTSKVVSKTTTTKTTATKTIAKTAPVNSGAIQSTTSKVTAPKVSALKPVAKPKVLALLSPSKTLAIFIPAKKPAVSLVFKPVPKITKTTNSKVVVKVAPKPSVPAKKVVIKIPAASSSAATSLSGQAQFSPEVITANAFPPAVAVSEPVYLSAPSTQHYRIGALLGKQAEVRFTPIETTWVFSDGSSASGANPKHTFGAAGTYSASVVVRYAVSYRLAGQNFWISNDTPITLTDQVEIKVSQAGSSSNQNPPSQSVENLPYLVGENCLKNSTGFGC